MEVTALKVVVLISLGLLKLFCGLLPILLTKLLNKRRAKCNHRLIGVVLCIGGGVLLATVNVHMIPEVRESLSKASTVTFLGEELSEYPFAELLICLGFLLIFLIEAVVHKFFSHGGGHSHDHGQGCLKEDPGLIHIPRAALAKTDSGVDGVDYDAYEGHSRSGSPTSEKSRKSSEESPPLSSKSRMSLESSTSSTSSTQPLSIDHPHLTSYTAVSEDGEKIKTIPCLHPADANNSLKAQPSTPTPPRRQKDTKIMTKLKNILMVLALGFHGVFEGMAIGLQEHEGDVLKLFMAVAIHAAAIMFCCGMDMVATNTKKMQILLYVSVLSAVSPLGVAVGILVTNQQADTGGHHAVVVGVLQGLAGGTLLYVTFFEVLDRERLKKYGMTGLMGAVALVIGFSMMAALESVGGHSHGGGSHQGHLVHPGHSPHAPHKGHLDHSGHDHHTAYLYPAQVKNSTIDRIIDHHDHQSDKKHDHGDHDSHEYHDHENHGYHTDHDHDNHEDHDNHDHDTQEANTDEDYDNHENHNSHEDHMDRDNHKDHKSEENHDKYEDHDHHVNHENHTDNDQGNQKYNDSHEDHDRHEHHGNHDIHEDHTDHDNSNHEELDSQEDHAYHDHDNHEDHHSHEDHESHHDHNDHEKNETHEDQIDHDHDNDKDHDTHEYHIDHGTHENNTKHLDFHDHEKRETHKVHKDHDHVNQ